MKENLHERLASLRSRLVHLTAHPFPFDQEARVRNLKKAIKEVQDQIGCSEIDWREFGF